MLKIVGDFAEPGKNDRIESLILSFMPGSVPLQQRWRNNGLSADFLADYVTTFFPKVDEDPASGQRQTEIRGAVSYIANELLENAMKYSDERLPYPILIQVQLENERIVFNETNSVNPDQANAFETFIQRLAISDPNDMYIQQLETNAVDGSSSGLGLLTMINDYQARLSWKFHYVTDDAVTITTQVQLDI
ncbi:MAG: DUF6272 family protein [Magnetococcus sp. DMHC-1]|nr:ATP-binding protein [Magnetococcales bacterium]